MMRSCMLWLVMWSSFSMSTCSDPLRQRCREPWVRGTLVVVASWWGWAVCALRQPGVGLKRDSWGAVGQGKAWSSWAQGLVCCVVCLPARWPVLGHLHIKSLINRFHTSAYRTHTCRPRLASARASPFGMAPEAPRQPLLGR